MKTKKEKIFEFEVWMKNLGKKTTEEFAELVEAQNRKTYHQNRGRKVSAIKPKK